MSLDAVYVTYWSLLDPLCQSAPAVIFGPFWPDGPGAMIKPGEELVGNLGGPHSGILYQEGLFFRSGLAAFLFEILDEFDDVQVLGGGSLPAPGTFYLS